MRDPLYWLKLYAQNQKKETSWRICILSGFRKHYNYYKLGRIECWLRCARQFSGDLYLRVDRGTSVKNCTKNVKERMRNLTCKSCTNYPDKVVYVRLSKYEWIHAGVFEPNKAWRSQQRMLQKILTIQNDTTKIGTSRRFCAFQKKHSY